MFLYNGSKLEQDLKDLKREVIKSDYEKTIEPYQNKIYDLEREIFQLRENMKAVISASELLIKSIDKNYIKVIVCTSEPKAYYGDRPEFERLNYEKITIPIKQDLLECFYRDIEHYVNKYKKELEGNNE